MLRHAFGAGDSSSADPPCQMSEAPDLMHQVSAAGAANDGLWCRTPLRRRVMAHSSGKLGAPAFDGFGEWCRHQRPVRWRQCLKNAPSQLCRNTET